jgi:UDP-N-acetylmuramate dehydrogenase
MPNQRKIAESLKKCAEFDVIVLEGEGLAPHCTFGIGGKAAFFLEPADETGLIACLKALREESFPYIILGGGSNVLFPDGDFDAAVVSTGKLRSLAVTEGVLSCGAGALMGDALEFCFARGFCGLEAFAGLPGAAGGAAYMNARCYGVSISDVLASVYYIEASALEARKYVFDKADWDYKKSPFQRGGRLAGGVITGVDFGVNPAEGNALATARRKAEECLRDREAKGHFAYPSAGSVFKNSREAGKPAGQLIDEAGLKGLTQGGAQVAPWHGNIIINRGGATARDVEALIARVAEQVRAKTGVALEREIVLAEESVVVFKEGES